MTEIKKRFRVKAGDLVLLLFLLCMVCQTQIHQGIKEALLLCYTTVIPSLFPFMILSVAWRSAYEETRHGRFSFVVAKILRTKKEGVFPFVLGAVCGFPIGAKEVCALYQKNGLLKQEAEHLLGIANLASPAFVIFGIGAGLRGNVKEGIALYLIQLLSAILVAWVTAPKLPKISKESTKNAVKTTSVPFPKMIADATYTMLSLCGLICTFSAISSLARTFLPTKIAVYITAFLEIVGGTKDIFLYFSDFPLLSFALTACAISFGGISVHMQSHLFISETDLSFGKYMWQKILGGVFSLLMAFGYARIFGV